MQHSAYSSKFIPLAPTDEQTLLQEARAAIRASAFQQEYRGELPVHYSAALQQPGAAFVTLLMGGDLRGCIGSLQVHQPLIKDVIHNAQSAAMRDPRFLPLIPDEVDKVHIEISVLGPLSPIHFTDEADLLRQIEPFKDGLVLEDGLYRGTFLPLVWEQLPDKLQFWQYLKRKAGLPADYWSKSLSVQRYHTYAFEE